MITLSGCAHFFNFDSFLLYPTEVERLKCAMLGAFTVSRKQNTCENYLTRQWFYIIQADL